MVGARLSWLWLACLALGCAHEPARAIAVLTQAQVHASFAKPPSAAPAPRAPRAGHPDLFVHCQDRTSCPEAVGMLVVRGAGAEEPERCTATLIAPDRVLTASHCLAASQRRADAACDGTWITFPETDGAAAAWIACKRVVSAASVDEDALHQEHAVLELAAASSRAPLAVDPSPPEPDSIVTVVSVTPHPVYGTTHELATRLCRAIDSKPAERALGGAAAAVGWLASCPIERGNSGSPVLDHEGHVRAIVHGGTSVSAGYGVTSRAPSSAAR